MNTKKVCLSLSGGVDSTTLYALALEQGMEVAPFFFAYPSKHNAMEEVAARKVADYYMARGGRPLRIINLRQPFGMVSSHLLEGGGEIPPDAYDAESLALTLVPGRNLIFASFLAAYAESMKGDNSVFVGLDVHGGDHALYPDCRPEFIASLEQTVNLSSDGKVGLYTPFLRLTKAEIVRQGLTLAVPYGFTRSCYNGGDKPCGLCATCREREEAFRANRAVDPLLQVL